MRRFDSDKKQRHVPQFARLVYKTRDSRTSLLTFFATLIILFSVKNGLHQTLVFSRAAAAAILGDRG
jgi:hypothetical protein